MDWTEAVEIVAARTGHDRMRWLCSGSNPDPRSREAYRETVVTMAGAAPIPHDAGPMDMARNAVGALVRSAASGFATVGDDEQARRMGVCGPCEHFDGARCKLCGCVAAWKTRLATEHCPIDLW